MARIRLVVALAITSPFGVFVSGGLDGPSVDEGVPCPRDPPRSSDPGSVIVVEDGRPPCRFVFQPTGTRFRSVPDGSRPDPGPMVVRDSEGRFYTANARGWEAVIGVWDPLGEYVTSFGGPGEGPGELSDLGALNIFIDGRDRLHVRDGSLSWSVFSPQHEFLWRVPANVMNGLRPATVILDNGTAVTSNDGYESRDWYFHIVDSTGALHGTVGPVDAGLRGTRVRLQRTLAYGGGDTFWAGPAPGDPRGYVVEEWGIDGELRRAFHRDASWFLEARDEERRMAVEYLHIDETGLLYVIVTRATREFAEAMNNARRQGQRLTREEMSALTEAVVEMVDTRTGELLASEVYPVSEARQLIPTRLFRGLKQGAVYREDLDGFPAVDIVSVELAAR